LALVSPHPEIGQKIAIHERVAPLKPNENPCEKRGKLLWKLSQDARYLIGIYDSKLLVDVGTGTDRSIDIYDITSRKMVQSIHYYNEDPAIRDGIVSLKRYPLSKEEVSHLPRKPLCSKVERTEDKTGPGWEETIFGHLSVDLRTLKRNLQEVKCIWNYHE
jgi:hypothetical protein